MAKPSPAVIRATWKLLAYVRAEIKRGMDAELEFFSATRPAQLHDELKHFLTVHDPEAKQQRSRRG